MTTNILDPKDPSDVKDYRIDWTKVLTAEGVTTIVSSVWFESSPSGLVIMDGSPPTGSPAEYPGFIDGMETFVFVSGGTAGTMYELRNRIETDGAIPRTHEYSIVIPCQER